MASISRFPDGRKSVQFIGADGKRRTICLGHVNQKAAEFVKMRVESLRSCAIIGCPPDSELAHWIASLGDVMLGKLSAVGLIPKRQVVTLKRFIDDYIKSRIDTKPGTRSTYQHVQKNLIAYFGESKILRDVTRGDVDKWRLFLLSLGLSENTVRRRCGVAKQFFRAAMRNDIIEKNPFEGVKVVVQANPSRMYFVTADQARKVLEACPDAQWRLIFALCRYGGLRCPSEVLGLRRTDIDWGHSRMVVHSPKTEHHQGKDQRTVPIYPELLPYLQEAFDQAPAGTEFVITRYRKKNTNLRSQFERIICKAQLKPWPKLFQNLRSSRETELTQKFPLHVVCAWMGNSQAVAAKHYLQVTDEHFKSAAGEKQNPMQRPDAPVGAELRMEKIEAVNPDGHTG
jgi:integrase